VRWLVPAGSVDALVDALRIALRTDVSELARWARGQARVRKQHNADTEALKRARCSAMRPPRTAAASTEPTRVLRARSQG